jgi:hypothetical protein
MSAALENRAQIATWIREEGIAVTLRRTTPGQYDRTTGTTAPGTSTTYTGRGRLGSYSNVSIDGGRIQVGDRRLTFQPDDWTYVPIQGDVVISPSGFAITGSVQKRELGGVPFAYTIQLRGTQQ